MTEPSFLQDSGLRLLLFGGKGGVGKTTCAAATALHSAVGSPGKSFLLLSTDPAHSLTDSLADAHLPANLEIMELDARKCLAAFQAEHSRKLREIALRGTFLDEEDINGFLDLSLPGMDELTALLEISRWVDDSGHDRIIVDTAPTGHTIRLLEMPDLLRGWLKALDALLAKHRYMKRAFSGSYRPDELDRFLMELSERVNRVHTLLRDPVRSCFVPVMLAEELSISETTALVERLHGLGAPVADIVVNKLRSPGSCPLCSNIYALQSENLNAIASSDAFSGCVLWGMPFHAPEAPGGENLYSFWTGVTKISRVTPISCGTCHEAPVHVEGVRTALHAKELLLFAGKGGTGKTTLACATALHLAEDQGARKVFLVSVDPAHSLSACLGIEVGPLPVRVSPRLTAVEIDARAEFDSLKMQYRTDCERFLKSALPDFELAFDHEVMDRIFDLSPPGTDEVIALTGVMGALAEGKYDIVVIDSAPTGHLIRLLELPELIDQWLKVFFGLFLKYRAVFRLPGISRRLVKISQELKHMKSILADPGRSALVAVAILTEMAFQETADLVRACSKMGIHLPLLFLNMAASRNDCSVCSVLNRGEMLIREKFGRSFCDKEQVIVYRQGRLYGLRPLRSLGNALYGTSAEAVK